CHWDDLSLMGRDADPAASCNPAGEREQSAGCGPFEQRNIGLRLGQVPETGQLPCVQDWDAAVRRQEGQLPEIVVAAVQGAGSEAFAVCQVVHTVSCSYPL